MAGFRVRAKREFRGTDKDDLNFEKGDILLLKDVDQTPWGRAILEKDKKKEGWFPLDIVETEDPRFQPILDAAGKFCFRNVISFSDKGLSSNRPTKHFRKSTTFY
jgi:hypothetical protein